MFEVKNQLRDLSPKLNKNFIKNSFFKKKLTYRTILSPCCKKITFCSLFFHNNFISDVTETKITILKRYDTILPDLLDTIVYVYNGKFLKWFKVTVDMLGLKVGSLATTKSFIKVKVKEKKDAKSKISVVKSKREQSSYKYPKIQKYSIDSYIKNGL